MSKMTPEEQYREAFYNKVQHECRKHGINCSMCYGRIHIYTKYEDFYFEPNPDEITLMHRNAQKDSDGRYSYHIQGSWSNRTPESLVRTVVNHTKYRYTEDGVYRSEKDLQKKSLSTEKEMHKKNINSKSKPFAKVNRQSELEEFKRELQDLCKSRGLAYRESNQLVYIGNGFEEFMIELATKSTNIVNKKCPALNIKETYNKTYEPNCIAPINIVQFVESKIKVRSQEEYACMFYERVQERCSHYCIKCERKENRIYIYAKNGTYYVDAICGESMEIYHTMSQKPLMQCNKNANAQYVVNYVYDYDATCDQKKTTKAFGKIALIAAAISGWVVAGALLIMLLCS